MASSQGLTSTDFLVAGTGVLRQEVLPSLEYLTGKVVVLQLKLWRQEGGREGGRRKEDRYTMLTLHIKHSS